MSAENLSRDDIVAICPPPKGGQRRVVWNSYVAALTSNEGARLLKSYGICTPLRLVHLMATFAAETNLTVIWESGAYDADGIVKIFGPGKHTAKIGRDEAQRIAALPVEERTKVLFERVYGAGNPKKARELGNTQPGDGWRFRGLGLNQMTGRAAHENAAAEIGCSLDDLCQPLNCIHMALIEWDQKDCNDWADRDDTVSIRKLINGGNLKVSVSRINGLPDALSAVKRAKAVITAADFDAAPDGNPVASDGTPSSMAHSTEGQAAVTTGSGGAYSLYEGAQSAVQKAAASGDLSAYSVLTSMLAEPLVWLGAVTIATSVYWFLKRRSRLYLDGV